MIIYVYLSSLNLSLFTLQFSEAQASIRKVLQNLHKVSKTWNLGLCREVRWLHLYVHVTSVSLGSQGTRNGSSQRKTRLQRFQSAHVDKVKHCLDDVARPSVNACSLSLTPLAPQIFSLFLSAIGMRFNFESPRVNHFTNQH